MNVAIGSADDLDAVMRVMAAAFDPRFGEAWTASQCLGVLAMRGSTLHIVRDADDSLTGFALARTIVDECELMLLAVEPRARRRGAGRALLDAVVRDAMAAGAKSLHLEVRSGNDAVFLYSSAGLVQIGSRKSYYRGAVGQMFDAATFHRALI